MQAGKQASRQIDRYVNGNFLRSYRLASSTSENAGTREIDWLDFYFVYSLSSDFRQRRNLGWGWRVEVYVRKSYQSNPIISSPFFLI